LDDWVKELIKYGLALTVLVTVFFGGSFILQHFMGTRYPMMVVVSQSMVPNLGVGDFIIVGEVTDFDQVQAGPPQVGDILVFQRSTPGDEYIVHRAVEKYNEGGVWRFVTKGDNNAYPDGTPVPEGQVVGVVRGRIPILGYFSLFIKTLSGFLLVIGFMVVAFFFDNILPGRDSSLKEGDFPWFSALPWLVGPVVIASFWFLKDSHLGLEILVLGAWYIGCLLFPLSLWDDDTGLMVWLYHLVLVMIPVVCDTVWWTANITPSMWWYGTGSSVPLKWLLMQETRMFRRTFTTVLTHLMPGTLLFLGTMAAKRMGLQPFKGISVRLRGVPESEEEIRLPAEL
jgi:signal peptidase